MSGARSARRGPGPAPGRPGELLAALESAVDDGSDARRIRDADLDLHYGLVESTGNHRLVAYASTLMVQTVDRLRGGLSEPFRTVSGELDGSGYSFNPLG